MDLLAVFPDPPPSDLARTLDLAGYRWKAVGSPDELAAAQPDGGWAAAIVCCDAASDPSSDMAWVMARLLRKSESPVRMIVLVGGGQLPDLAEHGELFDDFCLTPFHPMELQARLQHLLAHDTVEARPEMVEHSGLLLNLETYQAQIEGRPLDLTYMEYELLKFLSQNAGKVFTRETLLSRVWGYEYYGGARTVDVHIRRLRAKLGEEHANLIQTVRSVGYRFGTNRWGN